MILARQPDKRSPEAPPELAELFDVLEPSPEPLLANSDLAYCPRTKLAPTLSVRGACVEDSDDLLPIFQSQSEVLAEHFGDFFLAEIIENADENNKQLVAVADDHAVGLLSASTDIDVATLGACFELQPFGNLVKGSSAEGQVPSEQPADAPAAAPAPAAFAAEEEVSVESNCMAATLFCLDAQHESRAADFFAAMFQLWPVSFFPRLRDPRHPAVWRLSPLRC